MRGGPRRRRRTSPVSTPPGKAPARPSPPRRPRRRRWRRRAPSGGAATPRRRRRRIFASLSAVAAASARRAAAAAAPSPPPSTAPRRRRPRGRALPPRSRWWRRWVEASLPPAPDAPPVDWRRCRRSADGGRRGVLELVRRVGTGGSRRQRGVLPVCVFRCRACVKICTVEIEDPEAAAAAKAAGKPAPKKKSGAFPAEAKRKASVMVTGVDPDAELQRSTTKLLVTKTSMPSIAVVSAAPSAAADPTPPPPPGAARRAAPPGRRRRPEDGNCSSQRGDGRVGWDRPAPLATC